MFKFNEQNIPSYVFVNDIRQSILPSISQNTIKINGRAGLIDFGNELAERTIEIDIMIFGGTLPQLQSRIRELSKWLYQDEAKKLVLLTESDKYYYAKLSQDTDLSIEGIQRNGMVTLIFICYDPFLYGEEKITDFSPTSIDPVQFTNNGSASTFPNIKLTLSSDVTNLNIISGDNALIFGQPDNAGSTQAVDTRPLIMHEDFSTLNGWVTSTAVLDGTITGEFISNGSSIRPQTWGTGSGWHGPAVTKSIGTQLEDFYIKMRLGNQATEIGQLGRVELYFLDVNGNRIGKIALRNGNPNAITPLAQFYLNDNLVTQTYGGTPGAWRGFDDGFLSITRIGNKWRFYVAMYDYTTRREHTRFIFDYVDENLTSTANLAQVEVHIGAYGTAYGPTNIFITDLKVHNVVSASDSQTAYIFHEGDELEIDNFNGAIYLNGQPYYTSLEPTSDFITFNPGVNELAVSPAVITTGSVSYKERWL